MALHGVPGHIQIYQPSERPGLPFPVDLPPLLFTLPHTLTELTLVFSQSCAVLSHFPSLCACCLLAWNSLSLVFPLIWVFPFVSLYCCQSWFFFPPSESLRGLLLLPGQLQLPPPSPFPCGIQGCAVARLLSAWAPHAMAQTCAGPSLHSLRHSLNSASPPTTQRDSKIDMLS